MPSHAVSVIVTCFNLGRYLPETIESIRAQTFTDFELCIIDDGSTDPLTLRVLDTLAAQHTVIRTENRGLSAARNTGVLHGSGRYVCTVDADDLLAPTLLQKSVERLEADGSLAFVSHWLEAFGDQSWQWTPERCDFPTLLDHNTVNGAALVRRSAVDAVGGWDERLREGCEDWDFWITLVERGFHGAIIPEVLFRYRRRPDSMSRVMFAGDGLSQRFGSLVEKHAATYRAYLPHLATRREVDTVGNRARADELDERLSLEDLPALFRVRDDLAAAERLLAHHQQERQRAAHLASLTERCSFLDAEASTLRERAAQLGTELATAREHHHVLQQEREAALAETARLGTLHASAAHEVAALRSSWSWRLTSVLRVLGAWAYRLAPRRS